MEYNENGSFEDRATQIVINRYFDVPDFQVVNSKGCLKIITSCMEVIYHGGRFSRYSLSARFRGEKGGIGCEWRYGDTYG